MIFSAKISNMVDSNIAIYMQEKNFFSTFTIHFQNINPTYFDFFTQNQDKTNNNTYPYFLISLLAATWNKREKTNGATTGYNAGFHIQWFWTD